MSILVLGLGNTLMSDDGFGVRAVERLQEHYRFPPQVALLDGGTLGLDLLPRLEGVDKLLIVDALEMGGEAGELFRLQGEEVPRAFASKLSVHQMGVQDLLAVAELQGICPKVLLVWGVQPESLNMRLGLSERLLPALERVVEKIVEELKSWGADPEPIRN